MTAPDDQTAFAGLFAQFLPLVQTLVAGALAYVARLLRNIHEDMAVLEKRVARGEVRMDENEKMIAQILGDLRRESDQLHRRVELLEAR